MIINLKVMKKKFQFLIIISIITLFVGSYGAENELFKKGIEYYQKQNYELAIAHLEEAKKLEPENSLVYFYLGNCYYETGDLDQAILNFTKGLNYTDEKAPFFYNLGNCYFLKGNYNFAIEMYIKAQVYNPELYGAYLNAGNAYYKSGDYQKTITQWETYLQKYPETPQYKNIEKAIAYLKEELSKPKQTEPPPQEKPKLDEKTGLDIDLLSEVLGDLEEIINETENVLESSAKPQDDLSIEELDK